MSERIKRAFFKQNGKKLKNNQSNSVYKEKVNSLVEDNSVPFIYQESKFTKYINILKNLDFKIIIPSTCLSLLIVIGAPVLASSIVTKNNDSSDGKYSIYSSKPLTLDKSSQDVDYKDSRAQKIDEIFRAFNCPLEGLGNVFVSEADKNDIPWWLVAAVSFQESGCGKKTPKVNSEESYNAWGWGVYGDNTHTFDNWARGIETVSDYFNQKFYSKGITELCDIMKIYTPPSNGSWCRGVEEFGQMIQLYQTP